MVNFVAVHKSLVHGLMKMAGVIPQTVEIEPGTVMNIWVPSETVNKPKTSKKKTATSATATAADVKTTKPTRPVVVLVHGFAADGIYTWQLQVGSLIKKYCVYVPDLLFFGGSTTDNPDRSPTFQAECLVKGLRKLGVEKCTVVGFSYGGMVAFKMAELHPDLVDALVVTGAAVALTDTITTDMLRWIGFSSLSELLLPTTIDGCKKLFRTGAHWNPWLPDFLYKDFLEVMFSNRKERAELIEALVVSAKDTNIPKFSQRILMLWGENEQIFRLELAQSIKEQLRNKATFQGIKNAGHLVNLERPCVYNRYLQQFLASLHADRDRK